MKWITGKYLLFAIIFGGGLWSPPFFASDPASSAEEERDSLRDAATAGDIQSQKKLAYAYFFGQGRKQNVDQAVYWFRKAADQGDADALYNLGVCSLFGYGVQENPYQAFEYFRESTAKGNAEAKLQMAKQLTSGIPARESHDNPVPELKPDLRRAERLLRELLQSTPESSEYKRELAAILLKRGSAALNGEIGLALHKEAVTILTQTANTGDPAAMVLLADCFFGGFGCDLDEEKGFSLLKQAMEANFAEAAARAGYCCENGVGTAPDMNQAIAAYQIAADAGIPMAQTRLGEAKLFGNGTPEDLEGAFKLFESAAQGGDAMGLYRVGYCLITGCGTKRDEIAGFEALQEAARREVAAAQVMLGDQYKAGAIVEEDPEAAYYWYDRAARLGSKAGLRESGKCLLSGYGNPKNEAEGQNRLRAAAAAGDGEAKKILMMR